MWTSMYLVRSIMFESTVRFYFLTTPSRDRTVIPASVFIQTIVTCKPAPMCWSGRDSSLRPKEVTSILPTERTMCWNVPHHVVFPASCRICLGTAVVISCTLLQDVPVEKNIQAEKVFCTCFWSVRFTHFITRYFTFLSSRMCRSSQYGQAMIFFGQSLSRCFCRNRFWNLAPQSFWQRISRYSQFTFTCSWNQNTQKGGYCPSTSYIELVSFFYIVMNGETFFSFLLFC